MLGLSHMTHSTFSHYSLSTISTAVRKMENHRRCLLDELSRAQEMLRQLQAHLDQPSASPLCKTLAQEILSCIEKAVSFAKQSTLEISEQEPKEQERRDLCKRSRKSLPTRTKQVRVMSGGQGSEEGSLNDGFQWRKYGEKEILGAKHRRSYFRCTHRHSLGCQATKQVQRTDEDPSILQVTYYGVHTCHEKNHEVMEIPGMKREEGEQDQEDHDNQQLINFQTYVTSALKPKDETSSSFSFSFNHTLMGSSSSTNFAITSSQLNPELGENISPDAMLEMNFILDPNFPFDDTPKFF